MCSVWLANSGACPLRAAVVHFGQRQPDLASFNGDLIWHAAVRDSWPELARPACVSRLPDEAAGRPPLRPSAFGSRAMAPDQAQVSGA